MHIYIHHVTFNFMFLHGRGMVYWPLPVLIAVSRVSGVELNKHSFLTFKADKNATLERWKS